MRKILLFLLVLFCGYALQAQVNPTIQDTAKTGFSVGKLELENPPSVLSGYKYDPISDRYIYTNSVDGFSIDYPLVLTPKQYEDLLLKESRRNYFRQKMIAIDGKKAGSEDEKKNLLPRYYINSGLFESIFGSNTIDVKPTGSVEMDLGLRYSKQDNPSFSPRNRSSLTFDFDQRISMSLMGKVGTRLEVNANYDTQSTFAFQNLFKLAYTPTEDDIVQKIEVGNVSMPLNSTLIRGAQSLFGVKAQLQFGKTTFTGVFSEQKSQTKSVVAEGGGTVQNFDLYALDYDSDRHFFLSQYFRDKYDASLKNYPLIDSRVQITRLEIWVTNKQNRVSTTSNNLRNVIALQDLGEAQLTGMTDSEVVVVDTSTGFFNKPVDSPTDNKNNQYDPALIISNGGFLNSNIREIVTVERGFNNADSNRSEGRDYSILENARKLTTTEYTFNPQLGYISLQQRLANDEILAVAYEYTVGGQVYQVGEFGSDGVDGTVVTGSAQNNNQAVITQSLILKMLKSSLTNVNNPVWNLMMKNIYQIPGAYQIKQDDFRFNILYTDPSPINYISAVDTANPFPDDIPPNNDPKDYYITKTPLLKVFDLDKLNYNNDPQEGGDGFFDYLQGITFDAQNGRIIFTTKEPFGKLLFDKLNTGTAGENYDDPGTYNPNQRKYVFKSMYANTQAGALQDSDKNKFLLRGKYKSSGNDGIPIGAFNVPQGSVVVTAAGRVLVEGIDYSVDYQLGRVQILDPSLQASNTPIEVSLENNSVFGQQTRRFMGLNVEHKISDKFIVGGTYLKMTERPFTQKSSYGQESVNNTIFGFNGNYSTEIPFFTRLVNKLPNIDTDVPSNLSIRGEVAFLKPDAPKASDFEGEATIYVDDFEGSQTTIDMRSAYAWSLASTPFINSDTDTTFGAGLNSIEYGYKRAKIAWYSIDPIFYTQKPDGISNDDLSLNTTRRVYSKELYPNTDIAQGQLQVINTLDLTYYPSERGPYNNNPNFGSDPVNGNFGGIMRSLNSTNFEQSNVEYIQFWMLDPYYEGNSATQPSNTGKIYFNLGEVSEDILKDGRKQYENGLGPDQIVAQPTTGIAHWGDVPASQSLIYAFDNNAGNRANQDVGLDGLPNSREGTIYTNYAAEEDPAADNYTYFLNTNGGVLDRYKKYNGVEGNSAVDINDANRGSTTLPDVEDINRDNTMNTINAYYEYSIEMKPGMVIGQNYITDIKTVNNVELPNGGTTKARWIQFKIPVRQPEKTIGTISEFRSIRFMRMFMTGFTEQITVRFGSLDLVRGEWRKYENSLQANDDPKDDGTIFDVQAVNIQENSTKCPVNYVMPPNVQREQLYNNNTVINQNEQSLALRVSGNGLEVNDARAAFKNVSLDMRQYKKLKMFLHAESLEKEVSIGDDEMVAFIRFGNDFTENFYQVEIPLKVTVTGGGCNINPDLVWPEQNAMDLALSLLTKMKIKGMSININSPKRDANGIYYPDNDPDLISEGGDGDSKLKLGIKGNPNFGMVRNLMVGLKNNVTDRPIKGEVWFNELRLSDMDNKGGMAAILNVDTNMADFATVSATGRKSTIGFGSIEEGANERDREDIQQYNIVTNLNLGKLLPPKWGINLPFNYAIGEEVITPEYDPFNQDIKLEQLLDETTDQAQKDNIKNRAIDYTKRKSINFIGVRKERAPEQKSHVYDIENFTLSQSYNQVERHDYEIEDYEDELSNSAVNYAYTFQPKEVVPFKQTKFMKKSEYWKLLSDFNFNYLPSNISFNSNIIRQSNRQQFRQVEDVQGIGLDALYRRNFAHNYQYGFGFNLTKSLKLNYTASSNNIVKNYLNDDSTPKEDFSIWDDYFDLGTPNQHTQQLILNYDIPIYKLPIFSFVKANYSYTADYNWQRSSTALSQYVEENPDGSTTTYNLGNTIQNANSNTLSTTLNMTMLYKYLGLTPGAKAAKPKPTAPPKPGEKIVNTNKPATARSPFYDGLIGVLTSVKNIQINYTENSGTVLPGYTPGIGFLGTSKPTLGFILGSQDDVRYESAKNGWLTSYQNFNQNFTQVNTKLLKVTANVDLFPDFKVDLTMDRSYSENSSEQYSVDQATGEYLPLSPYTYGMFSISTVLIKTAFSTSDVNQSAAFDDFRENRLTIANRLAEEHYGAGNAIPRYGDSSNPIPPETDPNYKIYESNKGYPIGFGKSNQAVLLPSFLSAYTGGDASNVSTGIFRSFPIPNWNVKYNGLMRYKYFKDRFKRFSLQHNYRASYTINQFRSNFDYNENPDGTDVNGNFFNKTVMSNVNLVEQFSPLIRVDFELKGSLRVLTEVKKDRALSMSFDNNLLTEVKGLEYVVGLGYRFKDVIFSSTLADNPTGIIKSDINIKADFSYRNNQTLVRYLDYDNNQLAAGQNIWALKLTADYAFSKNLTAIFYYDHSFSKAVISTSFPLTNIRSGLTLRYNFGN